MPRREKIIKVEKVEYDNAVPIESEEEALLFLGLSFNPGVIAEVDMWRDHSIDLHELRGGGYVPCATLELSPEISRNLLKEEFIRPVSMSNGQGGTYPSKHDYRLSDKGHTKVRQIHEELKSKYQSHLSADIAYEFQGILLFYKEDDPLHLHLFCAFQDFHGDYRAVFLNGAIRNDIVWARVASGVWGMPDQQLIDELRTAAIRK